MASNDRWPPVTSSSSSGGQGRDKNNDCNNKTMQNPHQIVLNIVTEMFESTIEYDVIISIAENCNWDLQSTIDALIALSATVDNSNKPLIEHNSPISQLNKQKNYLISNAASNDFMKMDKNELEQQLEGLTKFEQLKKNSPKNRMDSFRGNISQLDTSLNQTSNIPENKPIQSLSWSNVIGSKKKEDKKVENNNRNVNAIPTNLFAQQKQPELKSSKLSNIHNDSKFCGLKVHYRQSGTESSSEDDDADVVVEEELNDFNSRSNIPINVSQFFSSSSSSSSIQASPQNIQAGKMEIKTVESPLPSPKKTVKEAQLDSIKLAIKNKSKILILLRGLPGSGKSTFANNLITSTIGTTSSIHVFSTDDYFTSSRGVFKYDLNKLREAHSTNQFKVMQAMKAGITPIIVANTNLQIWEMKPYAAMAVKYLYIIEVIEMDTPWAFNINELAKKNIHGVMKDKIKHMLERYQRGISGDKLLEIHSLRYPQDMMPKRINRRPRLVNKTNLKSNETDILSAEDMEVLQKIENLPDMIKTEDEHAENNLKDYKNDKHIFGDYSKTFGTSSNLKMEEDNEETDEELIKEDNSVSETDDNHSLQPLGAIGCERKNSLVNLDALNIINELENLDRDNKDNVLSQCWDFELCLDGKTFHSDHTNDSYNYKKPLGSPINAEEMRKQDEEFGKENSGEESPPSEDSNSSYSDEQNKMDEFFRRLTEEYNENESRYQTKESTVIITEIFDDEIINLKDKKKMKKAELIELTDAKFNNCAAKEVSEINNDEKNNKIDDVTCDEDIEIILPDKEEQSDHVDGIESELNYVEVDRTSNDFVNDKKIEKNSINKNKEEISNINESKKSAQKSTLGSLFSIIKTSILGDGKNDEEQKEEITYNIIEKKLQSTSKENEANIDSKNNLESFIEFQSVEDTITTSEVFSDKIEEVILVDVGSEESGVLGDNEDKKMDNINRITWKESPFPLDGVSIPTLNSNEQEHVDTELVSMIDNSTNTSYYDFNVAFVGGTAESGYQTVNAFNRSINDGLPFIKSECPPMKLMLEKSSMTGDLFNRNDNTEMEDGNQGLPDLMDLFPHIPKDYLIEIYENLCQKNFSWAVDVLLDGVPDGAMLKIPQDNETNENASSSISNLISGNTSELHGSSGKNENNQNQQSLLDLINHDNNEIDKKCNFEVEGMKLNDSNVANLKTGASDDNSSRTSHSTPSVPQPDDISSESEEIIEINLGFDMIRELENQFGNSGYLIPDGFHPVVQMKKSMAEELYALWIESMYQQLNARHEQLDQMLAKDAEYAKKLEKELEDEENELKHSSESSIPNLNEIIDMEIALAKFKKETKSVIKNDMPDNMASMLSRQMLYESLPDIDPETLNEILRAHNGNFKATFDTIKLSTGKSITPCSSPKKHENIVEKVKEENGNIDNNKQRSRSSTPIIVVKQDNKTEKSLYRDALLSAKASRDEAQQHFSLRIESLNKADDAYRRGYPAVAAYYSQIARIHGKNSKTAHADAADTLIDAQTFNENQDILDLHYLFVNEALRALDEFIEYHLSQLAKSNKRSTTVYIITGKGARSNNGTGKIKPAVSKKLLNRNIRFSETNPGCLKVTLHRKNGID